MQVRRLCVTGALLCLPAGAGAQSIVGIVVDESSRPVPVAFIVLHDSAGRRVAATLTDSAGAYHVAAPHAGRYGLRAERIGYTSAAVPITALADHQSARRDLLLVADPIKVAGITVTKERGCVVRPQQGTAAARVWEDVRKALSIAAWTTERNFFRFDAIRYVRYRQPNSLRVTVDSIKGRGINEGRPFISRSAELLAERGYLERTDSGSYFLAPDAEALLSDPFLDTHCFELQQDAQRPDLIGLSFKPIRGNHNPDINGVLWVQRTTEALEQLDFSYVNVPSDLMADGSGGHIEFEALPAGGWVVRRWYIRMPVMEITGGVSYNGRKPEPRIISFRDEGGDVLRVLGRRDETIRDFTSESVQPRGRH